LKAARNPAPGAALLHPATLTALFVLALNDQVLKHACPGWWTGKLSDFAGLVLLPVFLHALLELAAAHLGRKPFDAATGDRWLLACVVVSALAFALPEVWRPAELVYRYGLGAARWPVRTLAAVLFGQPRPHLQPVRATADVSDLMALPMALVAFAIARRGHGRWRRTGSTRQQLVACAANLGKLDAVSQRLGEQGHVGLVGERVVVAGHLVQLEATLRQPGPTEVLAHDVSRE
jgi:hypothetical protein